MARLDRVVATAERRRRMIHVIGDRVLVALPPPEAEHVTASGLILTRDPDLKAATRGIVVQVGDKRGTCDLDDVRADVNEFFLGDLPTSYAEMRDELDRVLLRLEPEPFDVMVGEMVLFPPSAGEQVEYDGALYVILREAEIIGVIEPHEERAA